MNGLLYKYVKMELEQFAMFDENIKHDVGEIQFQTETSFSYDKEQHVLCNKIIVTFTRNSNIPLIKAIMNSYFLIHENSVKEITNKENNNVIFHKNLLIQFASLNYGSLRGVLFLKTLNTELSNYILPPLFFKDIIDKDFVVE